MTNKQHYLPMLAVWGVVFGLAQALPILCCCFPIWLPLAGLLSVMSVTNKAGVTLQIGEGVVIGLLAGAIAGLLSGVIGGTVNAAMGSWLISLYRTMPSIPPDQLRTLESVYGNPALGFGSYFCLDVILGPVLGCLGGLIGTQVFKKG